MSCGVGRRHGLDPTLLWLRRRPAATAPIQPLAWEPPYAAGVAQEMAKKQKKQKKQKKNAESNSSRIRGKIRSLLEEAKPYKSMDDKVLKQLKFYILRIFLQVLVKILIKENGTATTQTKGEQYRKAGGKLMSQKEKGKKANVN